MKTKQKEPKTIDEYIADFPKDVQTILKMIRTNIRKAAPEAVEGISYQMPVFKWNGVLIYFAAFKEHIGLYPPARGNAKFMRKISAYTGPKGNLRLPLDKPIPYTLISEVVKVRMEQNLERAEAKKKRKTAK